MWCGGVIVCVMWWCGDVVVMLRSGGVTSKACDGDRVGGVVM